ncbi:MAG: phospho-sugar mutase [Clostridia bacterium]|nr:phospho-sugar mutase [Clostridia bacterium]MBR7112130.1 phospho-sugar mutase [Clostridia bacterium]
MNTTELYQKWLEQADPKTREELEGIKGDENEIYDRFYRNLAFGTAGMRDLIGAGTNRLNCYTVRKATLGFARYLKKVFGDAAATRGVVIAHDNRRMSREFCMDAAGVLAHEGIRAFVFNALRPTPELSFAVRVKKAVGGIMITASHNPKEYNGYKVYDENGCQLMPHLTDILIDMISEIDDPLSVKALSPDEAGDLISVLPKELDEAYYEAVMGIRLRPDVCAKDLAVVYSPQHGTGNLPVREVLGRCGYNVIPVLEQCDPDPEFSQTKNPNPEVPAAYDLSLDYAQKTGADIAITTDPDCDRLGVAVKDGKGYTLLTGNQSGAILLEYIFSTRKEQGTLPADAVMCNTIVTSTLGDRICEKYGVRVEKTLTGFKFIGDKIHTYETKGGATYVFGYEESYGCLISDFARDKDGVQASLMLAEAAAYYKGLGKTLLDVLEDLYREHGYYLDAQTNVVHKGAAGVSKIAALLENLRKNPPRKVGDLSVVAVEDYLGEEMSRQGFPQSNVLRYLLSDGSFVAVRPSGTEPKCKYYYCVVGSTEAEAGEKHGLLRAAFEK